MADDDTIEIQGKRIGVDDFVKVLPSPGKHDGFTGLVRGWWITEDGLVTAIDIWGGKSGYEKMRSIRPERIKALTAKAQRELQSLHMRNTEE